MVKYGNFDTISAFSNSFPIIIIINVVFTPLTIYIGDSESCNFFLQIFVFSVQRGPFEEDFYQCVDKNYPNRQYRKMYNMVSLITQFMIPLGIMIVAYGLIFFTISRKSKEFRGMFILIALSRNYVAFLYSMK